MIIMCMVAYLLWDAVWCLWSAEGTDVKKFWRCAHIFEKYKYIVAKY